MTMRGIIICPFSKTIGDAVVMPGRDGIYTALSTADVRVGTFQIINLDTVNRVRNTLYVDDDGLIRKPPVTKFFQLPGYPQPIAGRGLILGTSRGGNSVSTTYDLGRVRAVVTFPNVAHVGFAKIDETLDHPKLGTVRVLGQRAIFEERS
jgi:hypothetical protein